MAKIGKEKLRAEIILKEEKDTVSKAQITLKDLKILEQKTEFLRINENIDLLVAAFQDSTVGDIVNSLVRLKRNLNEALQRKKMNIRYTNEMEGIHRVMGMNGIIGRNTLTEIINIKK